MFELHDFYTYCKNNDIDVIPYSGCPGEGATILDGDWYAMFLDFSKIRDLRLLRGVCIHELGHAATGALHKIDSPFELVERSEYRAKRWGAEHYMTEADFRAAFTAGYPELWQISEYFDLPEEDIKSALTYWSERRGVDFSK